MAHTQDHLLERALGPPNREELVRFADTIESGIFGREFGPHLSSVSSFVIERFGLDSVSWHERKIEVVGGRSEDGARTFGIITRSVDEPLSRDQVVAIMDGELERLESTNPSPLLSTEDQERELTHTRKMVSSSSRVEYFLGTETGLHVEISGKKGNRLAHATKTTGPRIMNREARIIGDVDEFDQWSGEFASPEHVDAVPFPERIVGNGDLLGVQRYDLIQAAHTCIQFGLAPPWLKAFHGAPVVDVVAAGGSINFRSLSDTTTTIQQHDFGAGWKSERLHVR